VTEDAHIGFFNTENFSLLLDRSYTREELENLGEDVYQGMNPSIYNPNKNRSKIAAIAEMILEQDFDFLGLCEIGGMETLEAFNRIYLEDRYDCFLYEENSTRGIFVGALVKKGRFPGTRAVNVKEDFSRNLLKIELKTRGGTLKIFVVHLKSQHGDDRGLERRLEEVEKLARLVRERKCVVMGDFNGILIRGLHQFEYEKFLELPLCDVLAAAGVPANQRHTHYYFGSGKNFAQLDYIFCTHDIDILDAGVLEDGIPQNRDERFRLPSDHLCIRAVVRVGAPR